MNDTDNQAQVAEGSDAYNQQMADRYQTQGEAQTDPIEELPVNPMPEGGYDKFYNKDTGSYDWENHAKELAYRLQQQQPNQDQNANDQQTDQTTESEQAEVNNIITQAGLSPDVLRNQLEQAGDLTDEQFAALERVGIPRDIAETYVDNLNYRREATLNEALDYIGGEQAWRDMVDWGLQNLEQSEIDTYNNLLATNDWRIAADAIRVRMGDLAPNRTPEPQLVSGQTQNGSTFGYRSKSEMIADMSNPEYQANPAFRQEVARKMQSATWDLDN